MAILAACIPDKAESTSSDESRIIAKKRAILFSIGLDPDVHSAIKAVDLVERHHGEVSVTASADVQAAIWSRKVISFRTIAVKLGESWICSAIALSDS